MANLQDALANIPGLAGYLGARQNDQQTSLGQLQQLSGVMGLQQTLQKAQQEQQYRQEMAGARTPEEQLAVASKYMGPDALGRMVQGSQDRQATREAAETNANAMREHRLAELTQRGEQEIARVREAEKEKRITRQEADAREATMRENMARLIASLRPAPNPPQTQPLVPIIGPDGKPRLVERKDAVGAIPAATGAKAEAVEAGKGDVDRDVLTLKSALDSLNEGGGITSTEKGVLPNVARWASTTGPGQLLGSMGGTVNQKNRDVISQARPLLMRSIMQATGMSAKQMDSNAELKLWLATATDPTKGYEANVEALNNIASKFGSGGFMAGQRASGTLSRRSGDVPPGMDPKVWAVMTPEEKKLFK